MRPWAVDQYVSLHCRRRLQRQLEKQSPEERQTFYAAMWYKRLKDHPELARDRVRCWSSPGARLSASHSHQPAHWLCGNRSLPWLASLDVTVMLHVHSVAVLAIGHKAYLVKRDGASERAKQIEQISGACATASSQRASSLFH